MELKKSGRFKKKSFKDKHFGKEDKRIGRLDENTMGYYRRVSERLSDSFENSEEKDIFLRNVFQQLCGEAVSVSRNQTVSFIIEKLLESASLNLLHDFMKSFSEDWQTAVTDRFASHVTQSLLMCVIKFFNASVFASDEMVNIVQMFNSLYVFLSENLAFYMQHEYGSHILRVVIEVLAGRNVNDQIIRSKLSRQNTQEKENDPLFNFDVPLDFKLKLKELCKKVLSLQKLEDHVENNLSNPVLQTLLVVRTSDKTCKKLIENSKMFTRIHTGSDKSLPKMLSHNIGSYIVEQILSLISDDEYQTLFDNHLKSVLLDLAIDPVGNFVLQRIITTSRNIEQFKEIFKKLANHLEDIMANDHTGVVIKLAQGCLKFDCKQEKMLKALMKVFHCFKPEERQTKFAPLLASLSTYEIFYKIKDSDDKDIEEDDQSDDEEALPSLKEINIHGSLLLQTFLKYPNPRLVITSLMDLTPVEFSNLACDPCGSHIYDALLLSKAVGEKNISQIIKKLQGDFLKLSCDKNGSRVIEAIFKHSTIQQKITIVEELSASEKQLANNYIGKFVVRSCALPLYKTNLEKWKNIQLGTTNKRKQMDELMNTIQSDIKDTTPIKKKKKK